MPPHWDNLIYASLRPLRCKAEHERFGGTAAPSCETIGTSMLQRRRRARLTEAQSAYLMRWGYPYVMEEWRFHMTLTASLGPETFDAVRSHLTALFAPFCGTPMLVDSICLFEQAAASAPSHPHPPRSTPKEAMTRRFRRARGFAPGTEDSIRAFTDNASLRFFRHASQPRAKCASISARSSSSARPSE